MALRMLANPVATVPSISGWRITSIPRELQDFGKPRSFVTSRCKINQPSQLSVA
jgi:hypothetical protein